MNLSTGMTALALMVLTGCASFPGRVLPEVTHFPAVSEKPTVNVSLSFRQYMNGQPLNIGVKIVEDAMQKMIIERFEESGLYSVVSVNNPNPDVSVVVDMKDEGTGSYGMAILTGLTLYIIPSSATDSFVVKAKVKNNKTGVEKTVEVEDFVTLWQEILLLPFLPFNFPPSVNQDVLKNIMDTVAIKVHSAAITVDEKARVSSVALPAIANSASEIVNKADVPKKLKVLKDAYDSGLITQTEYEEKKAQLEVVKNNDVEVLKKLKILKDACESGLITQTEYEQKKAELMKAL